MPKRIEQFTHWLQRDLNFPSFTVQPASADASFRRYFRIGFNGQTHIVMDAPPGKEQLEPFIQIARQFGSIGLNVPKIEAVNSEQGFLLMSDLGSTQFLDVLTNENVDRLYGDALGALAAIQSCGPETAAIPPYDRTLLLSEMSLFKQWYLEHHLGVELTETEVRAMNKIFEMLADNALEQPQVAVHRDYHSRNLMVCDHNPGILDFQDAVTGAVTYDLVSLLRDCYIQWPQQKIEQWVDGYHDLALDHGILRQRCNEQFYHWFNLMGVQRHIKAIGIFSRLNHRDGKIGYMKDIPRTLGYVSQVCELYPQLSGLKSLIDRITE